MASVVDICNLALSRLGDEASVSAISPPDGSIQAMHCARFYPIARDSMLEMHPWKFANKRVALATTSDSARGWDFAYAKPSDCLTMIKVIGADAADDSKSEEFQPGISAAGTDLIYSSTESAELVYTAFVSDTAKFSPLFSDALSWLLASYLAGPILKGDAGMSASKNAFANFRVAFSLAHASDANQSKIEPDHTPDWIASR